MADFRHFLDVPAKRILTLASVIIPQCSDIGECGVAGSRQYSKTHGLVSADMQAVVF
jgi:hypothetical protein